MGMVELKNIRKYYVKNNWVIKGCNLKIEDGEFCVLLGPSGCGKSTLLRMIAGLEDITEGEILIDGKVINDVRPKDRDISMVFQNYALYPHKTVYENIAWPLKLRKFPKEEIKQKVHEAAEILNLTEFFERYPKELSGGQRQRVAVGRALVRKPKVYLFDEPLSNLDAKLRTSMRSELKLLHRKFGTTFIYVTHDQIEAMTMADRIVLMESGVIQQLGEPKDFYNNPKNTFVGSFIGNPPMNFLGLEKTNGKFKFGNLELDNLNIDSNELIIGVRPEKLAFEKISDYYIEAKIIIDELIGKEYLYYLSIENLKTISPNFSLISNHEVNYSKEETIRIYFKKENLRYFNPQDEGKNLNYGD